MSNRIKMYFLKFLPQSKEFQEESVISSFENMHAKIMLHHFGFKRSNVKKKIICHYTIHYTMPFIIVLEALPQDCRVGCPWGLSYAG